MLNLFDMFSDCDWFYFGIVNEKLRVDIEFIIEIYILNIDKVVNMNFLLYIFFLKDVLVRNWDKNV